MAWNKITNLILILVVIVAILYIFFNPNHGYGPENLKRVNNLASQFFNIDEGDGGLHADEVQDSFNELYDSFLKAKDYTDQGCFIKLDPPSNFGNFKLELLTNGKDTELRLRSKLSEVPVSIATLEDITLCSVSKGDLPGFEDVALTFYDRWLATPPLQVTGPDVSVTSFVVIDDGGMDVGGKKNKFDIPYLYKPASGSFTMLCVIPSMKMWGNCTKAKRNGIDIDCLPKFATLPVCSK